MARDVRKRTSGCGHVYRNRSFAIPALSSLTVSYCGRIENAYGSSRSSPRYNGIVKPITEQEEMQGYVDGFKRRRARVLHERR
jgi:hypothetical protein